MTFKCMLGYGGTLFNVVLSCVYGFLAFPAWYLAISGLFLLQNNFFRLPPSPFTGLWPVWYLICVSCLPVAWPFPLCSLPFFSARLILSGASLPPMFGVRCFLITAPWLSPSLFNPLLVQSPDPSSVMPLCLQCLTWLSFGMSFVLSVLCFLFSRSSFPLHRMLRMSAPSFQMFQYSISGA